jgi:hypothetical protein
MARPRLPIDEEQVTKLASYGCTGEEIADFFGCERSTITKSYSRAFEQGKAMGKTSLRRWQFKKARAGCSTMLIHLGGVYLGQRSKLDVTSGGEPIQVSFERIDNPRDADLSITDEPAGLRNGRLTDA